jgi:hypothetical protein
MGLQREEPFAWAPNNSRATIKDSTDEQEVFCVVGASSNNPNDEVQIKLHPDKFVLRRDAEECWKGIIVSPFDVQIQVGGIWIKVGHDGAVKRQTSFDTTFIEADGTVLKNTQCSTASMSADALELTSVSKGFTSSIKPNGIIHKANGE